MPGWFVGLNFSNTNIIYVANSFRESMNGFHLSKMEQQCQSCVFPCGGNKILQSVPSWSKERICYTWKYVNKSAKYCVLELAEGQIALVSIVCHLGEWAPICLKGHEAASVMCVCFKLQKKYCGIVCFYLFHKGRQGKLDIP